MVVQPVLFPMVLRQKIAALGALHRFPNALFLLHWVLHDSVLLVSALLDLCSIVLGLLRKPSFLQASLSYSILNSAFLSELAVNPSLSFLVQLSDLVCFCH